MSYSSEIAVEAETECADQDRERLRRIELQRVSLPACRTVSDVTIRPTKDFLSIARRVKHWEKSQRKSQVRQMDVSWRSTSLERCCATKVQNIHVLGRRITRLVPFPLT